ncbi:MAG: N-acetylmuramoyl-L-alanine amidase [Methylovulum sp.]|uniref:N-acetylmuramoyl-L-alanine amidase family protein n=1 Tax=Methylovulum sp. TaxID=1916980 RepID=UPI002628BD43|nr:N-acetylmuramoyl-L-alanine amidase [Methylovulum sp.]MDD2725234.1 N-acetylmuramoyl-L-alanine amidase [Methylovulum sp.]MDD5124786.1 N-acetylmuramoyl-L-alanine amidase [Methylovulum sp.]
MEKLAYRLCAALALAVFPPSSGIAKSLAIDVGHSIAHSGAVSAYGKPEFAFNAALANSIAGHLSGQGTKIIKIGFDGMMNDLPKRTPLANAANADFFLSIHHDSAQAQYFKPWQWQGQTLQQTDHASGFSLFVSRKNPQLASSLNCASALGRALKQDGFHPSRHHAEAITGEGKEWADQANGVFYYDNLVVLKTAAMPAVLLEAAVIANRLDEETVRQPETRQRIAAAVAKGLANCGVIRAAK